MLIASLGKIDTPCGDTVYFAYDPIDGEQLTRFFDTIMQVDDDLGELDVHWGLMLASHRGESDVPDLISEEEPFKPCCESGLAECNSVYCQ